MVLDVDVGFAFGFVFVVAFWICFRFGFWRLVLNLVVALLLVSCFLAFLLVLYALLVWILALVFCSCSG